MESITFINETWFASFMGRIKTQQIKSAGNELFEKYEGKFTPDFEENKVAVSQVAEIYSKKIRNILAGYLTKKAKGKA